MKSEILSPGHAETHKTHTHGVDRHEKSLTLYTYLNFDDQHKEG
jgi:predicted lipoprotein with Yx(FWY)xxD motif